MALLLEMQFVDDGQSVGDFIPISIVEIGACDGYGGSISNNTSDGREILLFKCVDADHSIIGFSKGGADFEIGDRRAVLTQGMELLATLRTGESYQRRVKMDTGVEGVVRWTHQ